MIGLVLIYFIGKAFYDLSDKYNRNKWGFAILGVVSYYGGLLLGGFILGVAIELFELTSLVDLPDTAYGLMAIPAGALVCWGVYKLLEARWSNPPATIRSRNDILDDDFRYNKS